MTQLTKKAPTANSSAINHKVKISSEEDFPGLGPQTTSDATGNNTQKCYHVTKFLVSLYVQIG